MEPKKFFDRLLFEGYRRADSVRTDGLKKSQNAKGKMDIKSDNIGVKTVMVRDAGEFVAEYLNFRSLRQSGKDSLAHYAVTRKRDDSIFRS